MDLLTLKKIIMPVPPSSDIVHDWWSISAAWMQALGATIAVALAVILPRRAYRKTVRDERQVALDVCMQAVSFAFSSWIATEESDPEDGLLHSHHAAMQYKLIDGRLSKINPSKLESPALATLVAAIHQHLAMAAVQAEHDESISKSELAEFLGDISQTLLRDYNELCRFLRIEGISGSHLEQMLRDHYRVGNRLSKHKRA